MYFITICVEGRLCLFGDIASGVMELNEFGHIAREEWERSAEIRPEISLDAFVVMPNHLHGVVSITGDRSQDGGRVSSDDMTQGDERTHGDERAHSRAPLRRAPKSLGAMVAGFKVASTKRINMMRYTPGERVWQRNYYEHIVRHEDDLNRIRAYIMNNPLRWHLDRENPEPTGEDEFDRWLSTRS